MCDLSNGERRAGEQKCPELWPKNLCHRRGHHKRLYPIHAKILDPLGIEVDSRVVVADSARIFGKHTTTSNGWVFGGQITAVQPHKSDAECFQLLLIPNQELIIAQESQGNTEGQRIVNRASRQLMSRQ